MWNDEGHFDALLGAARWDEAQRVAQSRLHEGGPSEGWLLRHAMCCMAQGRFAEALQSFDAAVCEAPASVESLLAGSVVLADLGFYDEAAKRYEAAMAVAKQAVMKAEAGKGPSAVITAATHVSGSVASLEKGHLTLARTYLDASDTRSAQEQVERALGLHESPDARRLLASIHVRMGEPARALVELERARQLVPHDPRAHVEAALCYLALGREPEAKDALVRAETLGDPSMTGDVLRRSFLSPRVN